MAICDFRVKYNPDIDTPESIGKRILYSILVRRTKANKPNVIFIGADSGEGKSFAACRLQEVLLEIQGIEYKEGYLRAMNVFTPFQYPEKLNALLYDKDLKKVNILAVHDSRELIRAKNWHTFVAQAISDVNAMSRSIKRLTFIIISQFIRDITNDVRYTLNFYCKIRRPNGKKARLYIYMVWKDDRDIEKPKLRKRKLSGYLVYPDGRHRRYTPEYIELSKPSLEHIKEFEEKDIEAKKYILKRKMKKLMEEMAKEAGTENQKINSMVDYYCRHTEQLSSLIKRRGKKVYIKQDIKKMHDLTKEEAKEFKEKLEKKLCEKEIIKSVSGEKNAGL